MLDETDVNTMHGSLARCCGNGLISALTVLVVACSEATAPTSTPPDDTTATSSKSLTGNWGSNDFTYAAFALTENNGAVRGHGWIGAGNAVVVEGNRAGDDVVLSYRFRANPIEATAFRATFANNALIGDIHLQRISLTRVDTVAEGFARVAYGGAVAADSGHAFFSSSPDTLYMRLTLKRGAIDFVMPSVRLTPGSYQLGRRGQAQFGAEVSLPSISQTSLLEVTAGQLQITRTSKRALIGTFQMDAQLGNQRLTLTGSFSAACHFSYVVPPFPASDCLLSR